METSVEKKFFKCLNYDIARYRSRHHNYISYNEADDILFDDLEQIYKNFPFTCSQAIPISDVWVKDVTKLPLNTMDQIYEWKNKMNVYHSYYKRLPINKRTKGLKYTHKGTAIVPVHVWKYLQLKQSEPDKYFDELYDWYRSGDGNLCGINFDDDYYIIQSAGNEIRLNTFENQKLNSEESFFLEHENEAIVEIKIHEKNSQYTIIARQKYGLFLLDCDLSSDSINLMESFNSEIPITSSDRYSSKICYSLSDGSIYLTDIEFKKKTKLKEIEKVPSSCNWLSVQFMNSHKIICTNAPAINIFDKRTPEDCLEIPNRFRASCDNFIASKIIKNDYLLIASLHNLYLYDLRCIKNDEKCKCLMKWAHGFKTAPLNMTVEEFDEKLLIAISNSAEKDLRLMIYDLKSNAFYMPFSPEAVTKSLYNAQIEGRCLNILDTHKNRFRLPRNGCLLRRNDNGFDLFTSNIAGDVFHQSLNLNPVQNDIHNDPEIIENWIKKLPSPSNKFTVSKIYNATAWKNLILTTGQPIIHAVPCKKIWHQEIWQGERDLKKYQDVCSIELFSAWEMTKMDEEPMPAQSLSKSQSNVASWLMQDALNVNNEYVMDEF